MNWLAFFGIGDTLLWSTTLLYVLMLDSRRNYASNAQKKIAWALFASASVIACFLGGLGIKR